MTEPLDTGYFLEIADVVLDEKSVLACSQQLLDGQLVPLLALGVCRLGEDGQPRSPARPLLIWPADLAIAEGLVAQAIEMAPRAPKKVNTLHTLARDGELTIELIRPKKVKNGPPPLVAMSWVDGGGVVVVELQHLPSLASLLRQARAKLAEQGLDPTAPGRAH
jgi:hypothetical protein